MVFMGRPGPSGWRRRIAGPSGAVTRAAPSASLLAEGGRHGNQHAKRADLVAAVARGGDRAGVRTTLPGARAARSLGGEHAWRRGPAAQLGDGLCEEIDRLEAPGLRSRWRITRHGERGARRAKIQTAGPLAGLLEHAQEVPVPGHGGHGLLIVDRA